MSTPLSRCRRMLAALWFGMSVALFLIVFVQMVFSASDTYPKAAFGWLLPSTMPTLSLMVGVMAGDALGGPGKATLEASVDPGFFRLTFGVSLFYLVLLLLVLLLQPFAARSRPELLTEANYLLGPFQGLVAGLIGALFVKRDAKAGTTA